MPDEGKIEVLSMGSASDIIVMIVGISIMLALRAAIASLEGISLGMLGTIASYFVVVFIFGCVIGLIMWVVFG
ncbi:hypothetical protein [Methanolobus bombayensis]|uniref:hypothetical protein n=1 Tax=Methanolobus bombayensis TaxID=38023 RepID=UPI001AE41958|nr:hypothetical protein [Methanolobus bombayensis]MBP1908561.1 ABC-type long-subunit fatty acid transport system fused permease/ATPase subunit [Methanolobus bombayensis]